MLSPRYEIAVSVSFLDTYRNLGGSQLSRMVTRLMHRLLKKVRGTYRYYLTRAGTASSPPPSSSATPVSSKPSPQTPHEPFMVVLSEISAVRD